MLDKAKLVKDFDKIGDFGRWGELELQVTEEGTIVVKDPDLEVPSTTIFKEIAGIRVEFQSFTYLDFDTVAQVFETIEKCLAFQIF